MKPISAIVFIVVLLSAGLASAVQPGTEMRQHVCYGDTIRNDVLEVSLSPVTIIVSDSGRDKVAFELTVVNKTDHEMAIDWNETTFMDQGRANGGFTFEPLPAKEQIRSVVSEKNSAGSTLIPAKGRVSTRIWPMALTYYAGPSVGWFRVPMANSREEGIYLSLKMGKNLGENEKIALDMCGSNKNTG